MVAILVAAGAPTPLLPIYQKRWGFAPWMLTLAFGVYAIALLVAILVIGALSDHIGRRPLMIAALALDLVAMLVFLFASSIGWLIVALITQGTDGPPWLTTLTFCAPRAASTSVTTGLVT